MRRLKFNAGVAILTLAALAMVVVGSWSLWGCSSTQISTGDELVQYAPPFTVAKMSAACGQPNTDLVAAQQCLVMQAFAAFCTANLSQQAAAVNAAAGAVGAVAAATGQAGVAAGVAVGTAANSALVPAFTAAQLAQCAPGGFVSAAAASATPAAVSTPLAAAN